MIVVASNAPRVVHALNWRACKLTGPWLTSRMTGMHAREVYGHSRSRDLPHPFGWRWTRDWHRDVLLLMPWWMFAAHWVWLRRWWVLLPFARVGLLQGPEGCEYRTLRPTWRVWKYWRIRRNHPRFTAWCEEMVRRWDATMPRWT